MSREALGIYIHIPFCVKKCAYCDFLSMEAAVDMQERYVQELMNEIITFQPYSDLYKVDTVFIGGGTPSAIDGKWIAEILSTLRKTFLLTEDAEITIEANPGTLSAEKLSIYRKEGINRISMGLQSTHNEELYLLGRIHTYEQFLENYENARKAGFDNINIDIMFGLPGQTVESWKATLERVTALSPEHISAYGLIIEEGTPFYKQYGEAESQRKRGITNGTLPSEEEERNMYECTKEILKTYQYEQYEISNYARNGFECRHNCKYWTRKPYLGIGVGAASLIEEKRVSNGEKIEDYRAGILKEAIKKANVLSQKEQMEEFMFLGLRMNEGIDKREFYLKFQVKLETIYGEILKKLEDQKLVVCQQNKILLTDKGINVSNYVLAEFLI